MRRGLLRHVPSEDELARVYWELASLGAASGGARRAWKYSPASREELLALACEMSRYDARLLSVLVAWLSKSWSEFNPLEVRRTMGRMSNPRALCVVVSFVRSASRDRELRHFVDYVCAGWGRNEAVERFFFDADRPQSRLAERRLGSSLVEYSRWGFIGTERPQSDVFEKLTVGRYDRATRLDILRRLAQRRGEVALSEYRAEIDDAISRAQSVADAHAAGLLQRGEKRGSRWVWPTAGTQASLRGGRVVVRTRTGAVSIDAPAGSVATILAGPDGDGALTVRTPLHRGQVQIRSRDLVLPSNTR